jgi:hypothetical protein
MMLEVRRFRPNDLSLVRFPPSDPTVGAKFSALCQSNPSATVTLDGEILFVGGFVRVVSGRAEAWVSVGPLAEARPLLFHRTVARLFDIHAQRLGLWKVRVVTLTPEPEPEPSGLHYRAWRGVVNSDRRWLKLLGFVLVGKAGPDCDVHEKIYLERVPFVRAEAV